VCCYDGLRYKKGLKTTVLDQWFSTLDGLWTPSKLHWWSTAHQFCDITAELQYLVKACTCDPGLETLFQGFSTDSRVGHGR